MNHSHDLSTDLDRLHHAHEAPRGVHVKTNGTRCKSPAMKKDIYCFFHLQLHTRPDFEPIDIGTLEDANSIQMSIQKIVSAVLRGQIDQKTARLALYGLQIAVRNLKNCDFEPKRAETIVLDDRCGTLDDLRCDDPDCYCNDEASPDNPRDDHKWVGSGDNDPLRKLHERQCQALMKRLVDPTPRNPETNPDRKSPAHAQPAPGPTTPHDLSLRA